MLREVRKQRALATSPLKGPQVGVNKKNGTSGGKGASWLSGSDLIVAPRPSWVPDKSATDCYLCATSFSIMNRRHHCRQCGNVFCGQCTRFRKGLPEMGYSASNQLRVCFTCYALPVTDSIAAAAKRKRDAGDSGQSLYTSTMRQRPSQREASTGGSSRTPRRNPSPTPSLPARASSAPTSPASSPPPSPPKPVADTTDKHQQQQHEHHQPCQEPTQKATTEEGTESDSATGAYNPLILDGTALRRESRGDRYEVAPSENEDEDENQNEEGTGGAKAPEVTLLPSLPDSSPLFANPSHSPTTPQARLQSSLSSDSPVPSVTTVDGS